MRSEIKSNLDRVLEEQYPETSDDELPPVGWPARKGKRTVFTGSVPRTELDKMNKNLF